MKEETTTKNERSSVPLDKIVMPELPPTGANYIDNGPSNTVWLRINNSLHDYWCGVTKRWVTFEGGHNEIRKHWSPIAEA